jgi:hypothetical protein
MSNSHPVTNTAADSPSSKLTPEASGERKKKWQTQFDAQAPPKCEMCDAEVKDMEARRTQ